MTQTRLTTLAALLMAALFLAGCGGGGGGGEPTVTQTVHDELQAELDAALATLTKEREAKAAAEEARAAADTARMAADEARQAAEAERDTAQQARTNAEAAQAAAQDAQAMAETARQAAADAQTAAEGERDTAEALEAAAKAAEALALAAEMAAKAAQATAEAERDDAKAAELAAKAAETEALAAQAEAVAAELAAKAAQTAAEAARDKALADKTAVEADRDAKRDAARDAEIELIEVKAARDAALAQVTRLTGELETVKANVTRLTNQIGTADDSDSLQGMLAAEKARVATLTAQIGSAQDQASDAEGASLHARLNAANAEVTRLEGELGTATDMADAAGSLHAQLAAEKDEVARLNTLIGAQADPASAAGSLYAQLNAANDEVARLKGEIGDVITPNSLKARLATAQARVTEMEGRLRNANDQVSRLTQDLATARGERDTARQRADDAEAETDTVRQQAQGLEANQQAERLLKALKAAGTPPASASRVDISVPSRNKLTFEQGGPPREGGYTPRTISAPGLQGGRLTRTRGGTQTTVVYTDIELSRSLIKHYDPDADATILSFELSAVADDDRANFLSDEDAVEFTNHGFRSSQRYQADGTTLQTNAANEVLDPSTTTGTSFSGKLHGISGTFECSDACTLTAEYSSENKLTGLTIANNDVANVTFKPGRLTATTASTAAVPLCKAPRSQCAPTDMEYMAFGWWRSEPSGAGDYQFEAFIAGGATELLDSPAGATGTAEYNGTAVGMYVEQSEVDTAAIAKKQGEFIADARLDATFDGTEIGIKGTIDSFKTTPTGGSGAPTTAGSWVVQLEGTGGDAKATLGADGAARIERRGPDGTGTWSRQYVPAREGETNNQPTAVVGTFESKVEDVLHLVGAFGAKRR